MNNHFIICEHTEYHTNGCDCCEPMEFNYYTFEDEDIDREKGSQYNLGSMIIAIYEYLGYYIPEHLEEYNERVDYVETMLSTLGVTWEIKQED